MKDVTKAQSDKMTDGNTSNITGERSPPSEIFPSVKQITAGYKYQKLNRVQNTEDWVSNCISKVLGKAHFVSHSRQHQQSYKSPNRIRKMLLSPKRYLLDAKHRRSDHTL